jgi:hypothetical protein
LNATVVQREKFLRSIDGESRLERVDIAHWAGLGGVRYIPIDVVAKSAAAAAEASDNADGGGGDEVNADKVRSGIEAAEDDDSNRNLIDHRNIQLVGQLRNSDSAFSLGEGGN